MKTLVIAIASCLLVFGIGHARSPFYDARPGGSLTGTAAGNINMNGNDILSGSLQADNAGVCKPGAVVFDSAGVVSCYPTTDSIPAAITYKAPSALPAAVTNTTGADIAIAPGQGSTRVTVSNNANCGAGDTVTLTINNVANVLTRGTQWTEGASAAATCTALRTAVIALTGIDSATTACNGAELDIYRNVSGYDLAVATNDATCFTVANGTDGIAKVYGSLETTGPLTARLGVNSQGSTSAGNVYALYWIGRASMFSPGDGKVKLGVNGGSINANGIVLDAATDGIVKIRNAADSADARIQAGTVRIMSAAALPTCDSTVVGLQVMYAKAAANKTSLCTCEQSGAATYAWFAATTNGDCT